ncbi:MBL fold metallo-hydrolase [Streptomyces sp. NBC_01022]|uniref:MBL fold metallo-hydrolase n=1 Tax=Streptomyces sp. NBC_01022 TaxID=2903723 RepID=UPI002DD7B4FB|nr:MBL fold metallo-hydrolase [Streptomyces sp. NBC_01022]WRZ79155.1 MBL fold metallo-hydrolase [Streptomyces sp. NBC_01022]WRZ86521.1 MBL fold metallo-hydrolase [Streptomyces sp. NBC_01022]
MNDGAERRIPRLTTVLGGLRAPDLTPWTHLYEPPAAPLPGAVRTVFLGVSTILLDDGETAILTDGFFSRPGLLRMRFGRLRPHPARIAAGLHRAGIERLDAVFVVHSHYDHALDSPEVAAATGARLIGSPSTHNIARGQGFPDDRFQPAVTGEPFTIGRFTLTALPARHSPGDIAPGRIDQPLRPPVRATDYRTGECYSLHVRHGTHRLLIHASAHSLPGALDGHHADTVYLGIGALGRQDEAFREEYWHRLVTSTGARRVIPIHWDDFFRPLDRPLRPFRAFLDDFPATMGFLTRKAESTGVSLALPVMGRRTEPWPPRPATPPPTRAG